MPTKRQQQGQRSRGEILDAASRLMAAHGYSGTSVADIARESGLPASSIYWHFASKTGVLTAVMERGAARFFDELETLQFARGASPREVIAAELGRAGRSIEAHPEFLRLFMLLLLSGEADLEVVRRVREDGRRRMHTVLCAAYAAHGEERATAVADRLVTFAVGVFDGSFLAVQNDPSLALEELMQRMTDALVALGDAIVREA